LELIEGSVQDMERKPVELAVVIPVYNEERAIGTVLDKWTAELDRLKINYQINVYNDGSRDGTSEILKRYASKDKRIIAYEKENSGHGPTILQGYRENSDKTWIFQIDSDDEMGTDTFSVLWGKRNEFDFLLGRRYGRNSPLSRSIVSFVSRLAVKIFYGTGVYDVNSPYRLMRTKMFKDYFTLIPSDTVAPNITFSGIACLMKFRVYETDVPYNFRQTGEVSIKKLKLFKLAAKAFFQTIRFRFHV
jgi:glycosyltransferase involved in cell wall biosynthesis